MCVEQLVDSVSIHAPPEEGDRGRRSIAGNDCRFNPRPPGGERPGARADAPCLHGFNPRPPGGGRRNGGTFADSGRSVSIHAPPEEGDGCATPVSRRTWVSIHAPPEESDASGLVSLRSRARCFNPRPPGGGRRDAALDSRRCDRFQSTPPRRRATGVVWTRHVPDVSIHAPPEEGDRSQHHAMTAIPVSIHAPPEEGDALSVARPHVHSVFQSTPPRRRATRAGVAAMPPCSCFNPRPPGGGRPDRSRDVGAAMCFNPRPPGGGRLSCARTRHQRAFQSTPPRRRAT